jgi:phage terminase small subunit
MAPDAMGRKAARIRASTRIAAQDPARGGAVADVNKCQQASWWPDGQAAAVRGGVLRDFNATQAAIRAGYSAETARSIGNRLRSKPAVAAAITQAVAALKSRSEASADRRLLEVLDIAYANPDAKTEDGKPATRLKFSEKVRALELQGRALGFVKQDLELKAQTAIPILIVHQEIA